MSVLMIAEQPNMDEGIYTSMLEPLMPRLRSANGFISHAGGPSPAGGMRIIEVWESKADQRKFFRREPEVEAPARTGPIGPQAIEAADTCRLPALALHQWGHLRCPRRRDIVVPGGDDRVAADSAGGGVSHVRLRHAWGR